MVRVKGPLLSQEASGKLGQPLVFTSRKGTAYVKKHTQPKNPNTGRQVGMRAMFKFLSQNWADIESDYQDTWQHLADVLNATTFNAYIQLNQTRWRNFWAPSQQHPPDETLTPDVITGETATAGVRQITLDIDVGEESSFNWGLAIFRQTTTPVVTAWDNCIAVIFANNGNHFTHVDTPLAAGTYYYNFRPFAYKGALGGEETEVNATVP